MQPLPLNRLTRDGIGCGLRQTTDKETAYGEGTHA